MVSPLIKQMNKLNDIQVLYASMNNIERLGIRFGWFPLRIKDRMEQLRISPADLVKYDKIIRAKHP